MDESIVIKNSDTERVIDKAVNYVLMFSAICISFKC